MQKNLIQCDFLKNSTEYISGVIQKPKISGFLSQDALVICQKFHKKFILNITIYRENMI